MAKIKHIAMTTQDPEKVAAFYKEAFDMQEVGKIGSRVFLTDGYINLTILDRKTETDADMGAGGPAFSGIHHIGVQVDDIDEACNSLEAAEAVQLTQRTESHKQKVRTGLRNYSIKWAGPDGVIIDVSNMDWPGNS